MRKSLLFLIAVTMFVSNSALAQEDEDIDVVQADEEPGLLLGGTLGLYISNDATANYYNGSGYNSIETKIILTQYNYDAVKLKLGYDFTVYEYASSMRYNGSAYIGGFIGYRFASGFSPYFGLGITNLKLEDTFTLLVDNPATTIEEDDIVPASITGKEKRVDFNLGAMYFFGPSGKLKYYVEAGINANYVKYEANDIYINDLSYSIMRVISPAISNVQQQGGFGFGGFAGAGVKYKFNAQSSFMLGANVDFKTINLVEEGESPTMGIHIIPYLRFLFG